LRFCKVPRRKYSKRTKVTCTNVMLLAL
jgi:hypothetical protein